MIGFILRGLGFGLPGDTLCVALATSVVAVCAICGVTRCMKLRMRDCGCIKKWMRASGADKFDDFEIMVLVHEVQYTASKSKLATLVRVTAGLQTVETDGSNKGIFQQPLSVFVEQGTDCISVDLLNSRDRKVLATLKLDPVQDILQSKSGMTEKVIPMKQKSKGVLNPRIKLTVFLDNESEAERGLLSGMDLGTEAANLMLRQQIQKVEKEATMRAPGEAFSNLELLAKGCAGPLDIFGSWGNKQTVYVAVMTSEKKKYQFGVWKDKGDFDRGSKANPEIDLLKIISVQPDPGRAEVFVLNYVDDSKMKKRLTFRRIDRARDVWVDMFQLIIKMVHEQKELKRKGKI